jgi:uncharacterized membrane protein (DUF2068 family)
VSAAAPLQAHTPAGVRTIAAFEALKGTLVLLVGMGMLRFIHRDLQDTAEELVRHFHLSPSSHYPRIFLALTARITDGWLWAFALGSVAYSALRFAESWGLWHGRAWAEWLAAISGGIYVPFEIVEVAKKLTALRVASLVTNLIVVSYMVALLWRRRHARAGATTPG